MSSFSNCSGTRTGHDHYGSSMNMVGATWNSMPLGMGCSPTLTPFGGDWDDNFHFNWNNGFSSSAPVNTSNSNVSFGGNFFNRMQGYHSNYRFRDNGPNVNNFDYQQSQFIPTQPKCGFNDTLQKMINQSNGSSGDVVVDKKTRTKQLMSNRVRKCREKKKQSSSLGDDNIGSYSSKRVEKQCGDIQIDEMVSQEVVNNKRIMLCNSERQQRLFDQCLDGLRYDDETDNCLNIQQHPNSSDYQQDIVQVQHCNDLLQDDNNEVGGEYVDYNNENEDETVSEDEENDLEEQTQGQINGEERRGERNRTNSVAISPVNDNRMVEETNTTTDPIPLDPVPNNQMELANNVNVDPNQIPLEDVAAPARTNARSNNRRVEQPVPIAFISEFDKQDIDVHDVGDLKVKCCHCGALFFEGERKRGKHGGYSVCCKDGKVSLPPLPERKDIIGLLLRRRNQYETSQLYPNQNNQNNQSGQNGHSDQNENNNRGEQNEEGDVIDEQQQNSDPEWDELEEIPKSSLSREREI